MHLLSEETFVMQVEAEITVVEGLQNGEHEVNAPASSLNTALTSTYGARAAYGTLHGGATCTIVDIVGTLALLSLDKTRPGVSVELNTSFVAAAQGNERIKVVGSVLKTGKRLGFTQVDIFGSDGRLCASGRHTKAL